MKKLRRIILTLVFVSLVGSCGVSGDPGHCFFALDWEYYNDDYGVNYFEDDNPLTPESDEIEAGVYYDCYPGLYNYYYESEDLYNTYYYTGTYELIQNPGTPGGLLYDGLDGADTYFKLYLLVYAEVDGKKAGDLNSAIKMLDTKESASTGTPLFTEDYSWTELNGDWTLKVNVSVKAFRKQ